MRTELEVARDAVRAALGDELADALEWAAAAVKHRDTLLSATKWAATEGGPCADCGQAYLHARECPMAEALHALDPEWSRREVESAHFSALEIRSLRLRRARLDGSSSPAPRTFSAEEFNFGPAPLNATNAMLLQAGQWPVAHADSPSVVGEQP